MTYSETHQSLRYTDIELTKGGIAENKRQAEAYRKMVNRPSYRLEGKYMTCPQCKKVVRTDTEHDCKEDN